MQVNRLYDINPQSPPPLNLQCHWKALSRNPLFIILSVILNPELDSGFRMTRYYEHCIVHIGVPCPKLIFEPINPKQNPPKDFPPSRVYTYKAWFNPKITQEVVNK
jgi:hypothetical protein